MVRSVLSLLDTLAQASLGAVRFRWQASALAYDPVAGLAEDPSGRCDRLLKSLVDRFFEPVVQPTALQQQTRPVKHAPIGAALRPQGSAGRDAVAMADRLGTAGVAAHGDRQGRFPVRRSGRTAAPGSEAFEVDDSAVDRILGRYDSLFVPGESAGGAMNSAALKMRSSGALSSPAPPGPGKSVSQAIRGSRGPVFPGATRPREIGFASDTGSRDPVFPGATRPREIGFASDRGSRGPVFPGATRPREIGFASDTGIHGLVFPGATRLREFGFASDTGFRCRPVSGALRGNELPSAFRRCNPERVRPS